MAYINELTSKFIDQEVQITGMRYNIVIRRDGTVSIGCYDTTVDTVHQISAANVLEKPETTKKDVVWWVANREYLVKLIREIHSQINEYWNEKPPGFRADMITARKALSQGEAIDPNRFFVRKRRNHL